MIGSVWRFGDAWFEEESGKLRAGDDVVQLDRQSTAVLACLLRNAGADVAKDALMLAAWSDKTVHQNSLAKAVGRLRTALGDQAKALETIYGYGYRLDVEAIAVRSMGERGAIVTAPRASSALTRRVAMMVGCVLLAAAAGSAWVAFRPLPPQAALATAEREDSAGRILWVDDHPDNNRAERRYFEDRGIAVYAVSNTADALVLLTLYRYDAIITDMGRGDDPLAGIRLVRDLRARGDDTPIYFYTLLTSDAQRRVIAEAGAEGVADQSSDLYSAVLRTSDRLAAHRVVSVGR